VLDLLHRDVGLDVADALDASEVLDLEPPIGVEVWRDDPQQEVTVAGHEVAFDNLWQFPDRFDEGGDRLLVLSGEPDAGKHGQSHADLRRVEEGHVAFDDARLLEQANPPQARRGREADALGELDVLTILMMASVTYMTRVGGYVFLRNRTLSPRTKTIMESAPGCVLITVIAPDFVTGHPADIIALAVTMAAATRFSVLPTVVIAIASAGVLRNVLA
jgi:uncharacterized membrane protein